MLNETGVLRGEGLSGAEEKVFSDAAAAGGRSRDFVYFVETVAELAMTRYGDVTLVAVDWLLKGSANPTTAAGGLMGLVNKKESDITVAAVEEALRRAAFIYQAAGITGQQGLKRIVEEIDKLMPGCSAARREANGPDIAKLAARQFGHHVFFGATARRAGRDYTEKPHKIHPKVEDSAVALKAVMTTFADALDSAWKAARGTGMAPASPALHVGAVSFTPAAAAHAPAPRAPKAGTPKAGTPTVGDGTVGTALSMLRGLDDATMKTTMCPFATTPRGCMKGAAACPFKH